MSGLGHSTVVILGSCLEQVGGYSSVQIPRDAVVYLLGQATEDFFFLVQNALETEVSKGLASISPQNETWA